MPLTRDELSRLIPHSGSMCLLDSVQSWDEARIECMAHSHRDLRNPLRSRNRLHALCGVEYAAQAMAVHGALRQNAQAPTPGFLAAVRDVVLHAERLDDVEDALHIAAEKLIGDDSSVLYAFSVSAQGRELLTGRASIFFFPHGHDGSDSKG